MIDHTITIVVDTIMADITVMDITIIMDTDTEVVTTITMGIVIITDVDIEHSQDITAITETKVIITDIEIPEEHHNIIEIQDIITIMQDTIKTIVKIIAITKTIDIREMTIMQDITKIIDIDKIRIVSTIKTIDITKMQNTIKSTIKTIDITKIQNTIKSIIRIVSITRNTTRKIKIPREVEPEQQQLLQKKQLLYVIRRIHTSHSLLRGVYPEILSNTFPTINPPNVPTI